MLHLRNPVLDVTGKLIGMVGDFLHGPDHPFSLTLDADGNVAPIEGAWPVRMDELKGAVLSVTVRNRERAPIVAFETTRVRVLAEEFPAQKWTQIGNLGVGMKLVIPERSALGLMPSWGAVVSVKRAEPVKAIWVGHPPMLANLKLKRGNYSWAHPSGFVHS
jgi:hypothetical protein